MESNGTTLSIDQKSISSLDPRPPTPSSPALPNHQIEAPASSAEESRGEDATALQSKRLCERWLDNLFMVLYEDLRVYTIWRAELEHFTKQQLQFHKPNLDWEMLGDLAQRLHHKVDPVKMKLMTGGGGAGISLMLGDRI